MQTRANAVEITHDALGIKPEIEQAFLKIVALTDRDDEAHISSCRLTVIENRFSWIGVDTEQPALAGYPVCEEAGQNKSGCAGKWIYIDIRLNDFIRSEGFCDQDRVSTASLRINGKKGRNQWIACPVLAYPVDSHTH